VNNAILLIAYNRTKEQHDLTVDAVNSAIAQDIPCDLYIVDNGSTYNETWPWLVQMAIDHPRLFPERNESNVSPVAVANYWMEKLFMEFGYPHILGIPGDVVLPSYCYKKMLERPEDIVAAIADGGPNPPIEVDEDVLRLHGDVHMSVPLVRKSAYDKLLAKDGHFFDEIYYLYCSDCDLKLRLIDAGISTAQTNIRLWHYGGASHRLAPEGQRTPDHAGEDRAHFYNRWGFTVGSEEWDRRIAKINEER
jgi:glycosyltransferase involved in cell wall biosynthesis